MSSPVDLDAAIEHADDRALVLQSDNTRNHSGNADRLARSAGDELRYALGIGWLAWDEQRWSPEAMGEAFRAAQDVSKNIHDEAAAAFDLIKHSQTDADRKAAMAMATRIWNWARDSAQTHTIKATLEAASNHLRFRVRPEDLDARPTLLNTPSGTLDLETFELRPHNPADLLTKVTAVNYDPEAAAPTFERDLERFIPDPEVRAYLQRWAGAALYGYPSRELQYLWGGGSNYKSTFTRALREAMGDYSHHTEPDILVGQSGRKSVSDRQMLAELRGKRLVTTGEIAEGQSLAEAVVKILTDPEIHAEFKHERAFNFRNELSFMFSANHKLHVEGKDDGIWDRLQLTEWGVRISATEKDEQYFERHLAPELEGILAWMVRGAQEFHARGNRTDPPKQVKAWSQAYRDQSDILGRWLNEEVELDGVTTTPSNELWSSFEEFTRGERAGRVSRSEWKRRLVEAGATEDRPRREDGSRPQVFIGIRLLVPSI